MISFKYSSSFFIKSNLTIPDNSRCSYAFIAISSICLIKVLSVKIWWAEPNNHLYDAEPGTIVKVEKDGIVVTCGDHAGLKITDIQISGKKRMDVASLLNGSHPIEVGKKFN